MSLVGGSLNWRAYANLKIFGKGDVGARNGDYPSQHRHSLGKQPVNGACGIDIENGAAGVGGQLAGGYLPACKGFYKLFFSSLGIFGCHRHQLDGAICRKQGFYSFEGIGLVGFNSDNRIVKAEYPEQYLYATDDLSRAFQEQAVVRCKIGLTLCAVDYNGIDLAKGRGYFYMGRESGSAVSYYTGVFDGFVHFISSH